MRHIRWQTQSEYRVKLRSGFILSTADTQPHKVISYLLRESGAKHMLRRAERNFQAPGLTAAQVVEYTT